jgi:uncharacterized protein YceK
MYIAGVFAVVLLLAGCSAVIDKDTKLSLKGPKAVVQRVF